MTAKENNEKWPPVRISKEDRAKLMEIISKKADSNMRRHLGELIRKDYEERFPDKAART